VHGSPVRTRVNYERRRRPGCGVWSLSIEWVTQEIYLFGSGRLYTSARAIRS